jgi:phosphate transport system substrate-binding protein
MKRLSTIRLSIPSVTAFILLSLLFALSLPGQAQTADTLNQVKKIYVDAFDGKPDAAVMRQRLIDSLRKTPSLEIVTDGSKADAILKARGETWVRAYISVNPRSNSSYPVYGGFLSAQLIGKDGETLWSYLVTPSRYPSSGIHQDLSDQLAKKLVVALHETASTGGPTQTSIRTLKASGATFPAPLYQAWIEAFRQRHADIQITYSSIGSESGIAQLRDGKVTFAASDVPLSDTLMVDMPSKVLQFATVIGAVVPIYHLPGVGRDLRFTPEVLAGIYLGKIRNWSDPAIKAINHGVALPDAPIVVVHRADGSGTTFGWTDFLSKTSPEWKAAVGSGITVTWPVGQGVQGNDGVASTVDKTPYSVGYTELTYAIQRGLTCGTVRNAAGNFTQANLASLGAAAASASTRNAGNIYSSLTNAPGKEAYPIASFTWLLIPESIPDAATKSAVIEFLDWILTTGQKETSDLAYNPLPKEIVARQLQTLATFKAK